MVLKILWATGRPYDKEWEIDWIRELLVGIGEYEMDTVTSVNDPQFIVKDALLLINRNKDLDYFQFLLKYEETKTPFAVIHLSDEYLSDDYRFYELSMCKFVYRNYYHISRINEKTKTFALGYKRGFWENTNSSIASQISYSERKYIWSFAGAPRHKARLSIIEIFKSIEPYKLCLTVEGCNFNNPIDSLSTVEYRSMLLDSKFALCPIGNVNNDTFRIYEALECGCIPIVTLGLDQYGKSYWESIFNDFPPFIMCNTWEECAIRMKTLNDNPVLCEMIRTHTYEFWCEYKIRLKEDLHYSIKQHLLC